MKKNILFVLILSVSISALAQMDSVGVYYVKDSVLIKIEPITSFKTKYNTLATALTAGLASTNLRAIYRGEYSNNEVAMKPTFYFYFPKSAFSNTSTISFGGSPNNFLFAKLNQTNTSRELVFAKVNIYVGTSMGVDEDASPLTVDKIKENVFKVSFPKGLMFGEYAFVSAIPNGGGAYLPIYDFSVTGF